MDKSKLWKMVQEACVNLVVGIAIMIGFAGVIALLVFISNAIPQVYYTVTFLVLSYMAGAIWMGVRKQR